MAINPLNNHYAMVNPMSVHDEEAMTALELAGRTTAKVNETVAAFNALEEQNDKKVIEQDTAIEKMSKETMPAEVAAEFQRKIDNGSFDGMIDKHSRELSTRLDNLLSTIKEGSTTGDAELIDARVDAFAGTWETAGNAMRAQVQKLLGMVEPLVTPMTTPLTVSLSNGWYNMEGKFVANTDTTKHSATAIDVTAGETYYIKTRYGFDMADAMTVDEFGNVVQIYNTHPSGHIWDEVKKPIHISGKAVKLYVNTMTGTNLEVEKVTGFTFKNAAVSETLSHIKWVCLGDSLTEVNNRTTKRYHDYIAERTGINVVNMGVSGTGYMKEQDAGNAFYQRAASIPADANVVTIFGSGNDGSLVNASLGDITDTGTDTICGCINRTIDAIYAIKPTVQLGIIAPTPWINNTPSDDKELARYCEKLEAICRHRGIPYLDLFRGSGLRPNDATFRAAAYSKDDGNGVHPDETGHKMIASHVFEFLRSLISME